MKLAGGKRSKPTRVRLDTRGRLSVRAEGCD